MIRSRSEPSVVLYIAGLSRWRAFPGIRRTGRR